MPQHIHPADHLFVFVTMLLLIINIHEHELEFHILAHLTRAFNNNNEQLIINKLTSDNQLLIN